MKGEATYFQEVDDYSGMVRCTQCLVCGTIANFDSESIKDGKCHAANMIKPTKANSLKNSQEFLNEFFRTTWSQRIKPSDISSILRWINQNYIPRIQYEALKRGIDSKQDRGDSLLRL